MSTRSIILVTGVDSRKQPLTVRLYQGSDGYPTDVLETIGEAISAANAQTREQNEKFKGLGDPDVVVADQLAGHIIGKGVTCYGMNVVFEKAYNAAFNMGHAAAGGFIEWTYLVDANAKEVRVLLTGGDSVNELADPFSYAKKLYPEYQQGCIEQTKAAIDAIEKAGYKVVLPKAEKPKAKGKKRGPKLSVAQK